MKKMIFLITALTVGLQLNASLFNEDYPMAEVCPAGKTKAKRLAGRGAKKPCGKKEYYNAQQKSALTHIVDKKMIKKAKRTAAQITYHGLHKTAKV